MRAVIIRERAPEGPVAPQVDVVDDWPEPEGCQPGELLVRCECSALNHMDLWVGRGIPGVDLSYPHVGGVEACGRVLEVGPGVDESWVGRRVVHNGAIVRPRRPRPGDTTAATLAPQLHLIGEHSTGVHRERYVIPAENAVDVGSHEPAPAAAFGLTTLTAYSMMFTKGGLRPGQCILITGIGGGVATSALALARWQACEILVTSRHRPKLEAAFELGARHMIHDEGQDWWKEVRDLTHQRGVDMVVDTIGQAVHRNCIRSLAPGGRFVSAGATSGPAPTADLARLFWNQLQLLGSTMGSQDEFREICALLLAGRFEPVIDRIVPVTRAREAWERLEAGEQMGKLVLDWTAEEKTA